MKRILEPQDQLKCECDHNKHERQAGETRQKETHLFSVVFPWNHASVQCKILVSILLANANNNQNNYRTNQQNAKKCRSFASHIKLCFLKVGELNKKKHN